MSRRPDSDANGADERALTTRRRDAVQRCLKALMKENPQFFYQSTAIVAREIHAIIARRELLDDDEHEAVRALDVRDIEMLLAFR